MIEGQLRTSSWDAQDGTKRYRTEVRIRELWLLGSGGGRPADDGLRTTRDIPFGDLPTSVAADNVPSSATA